MAGIPRPFWLFSIVILPFVLPLAAARAEVVTAEQIGVMEASELSIYAANCIASTRAAGAEAERRGIIINELNQRGINVAIVVYQRANSESTEFVNEIVRELERLGAEDENAWSGVSNDYSMCMQNVVYVASRVLQLEPSDNALAESKNTVPIEPEQKGLIARLLFGSGPSEVDDGVVESEEPESPLSASQSEVAAQTTLTVKPQSPSEMTQSHPNANVSSTEPGHSTDACRRGDYSEMSFDAMRSISLSATLLRETAAESSDQWFARKVRSNTEFIERKSRRLDSMVNRMENECIKEDSCEMIRSIRADANAVANEIDAVNSDLLDATSETSDLQLAISVTRSSQTFLLGVISMSGYLKEIEETTCSSR